jgi:hypothetical protein
MNQENLKELVKYVYNKYKNQKDVNFIGRVYLGISNVSFSEINNINDELEKYKEVNMLFLRNCKQYKEVQIYDYTYDSFMIKDDCILFYKDNQLKTKFEFS